MKRVVYQEMKERFYKQKELMKRLANLANTVDHCNTQMSFYAIASFAKAKAFANAKRKENGSIWFAESLRSIFQKKLS